MTLVAAVAIGIAVVRPYLGRTAHGIEYTVEAKVVLTVTLELYCLACGLLLLRLKKPRPPVARLAQHSGFSAVIMPVIASATLIPLLYMKSYSIPDLELDERVSTVMQGLWNSLPLAAGMTLTGAWSALVLGRSFRVRGDWLDRSCAAVGVGWMILFIYDNAVQFLLLP